MSSPNFMHRVQLWATATEFACRVHGGAFRDDGVSPYAIHPIRVAELLRHIGGESNIDILVAALLHDSIEKTVLTFEELKSQFGPHVATIVQELTFDDSLSRDDQLADAIARIATLSEAAKKIKLADRLDNVIDLLRGCGSREKYERYLKETDIVLRDCEGSCPFIEIELRRALKELKSTPWRGEN